MSPVPEKVVSPAVDVITATIQIATDDHVRDLDYKTRVDLIHALRLKSVGVSLHNITAVGLLYTRIRETLWNWR